MLPSPHLQPQRRCLLPAGLLSVPTILPFLTAGSAVILASAALPLPSCSWPRNWLLPSPGQQPWPPSSQQSSRGRRRAEVREARVHTSSSLCCQQPWAVGTLASATVGSRTLGSWVRGERQEVGVWEVLCFRH